MLGAKSKERVSVGLASSERRALFMDQGHQTSRCVNSVGVARRHKRASERPMERPRAGSPCGSPTGSVGYRGASWSCLWGTVVGESVRRVKDRSW
eukprot:5894351-Prymnesium_polylepis.3